MKKLTHFFRGTIRITVEGVELEYFLGRCAKAGLLFWGVEWVQELHEALASTLIACAGLHALAAMVMGRIERTNLVRAMFTGFKIRPQRDDQSRSF